MQGAQAIGRGVCAGPCVALVAERPLELAQCLHSCSRGEWLLVLVNTASTT